MNLLAIKIDNDLRILTKTGCHRIYYHVLGALDGDYQKNP
jgi:hypothetical protein